MLPYGKSEDKISYSFEQLNSNSILILSMNMGIKKTIEHSTPASLEAFMS